MDIKNFFPTNLKIVSFIIIYCKKWYIWSFNKKKKIYLSHKGYKEH